MSTTLDLLHRHAGIWEGVYTHLSAPDWRPLGTQRYRIRAEVFDSGGLSLGKTPLRLTVRASSTPLALVFKHAGMKDKPKSVPVTDDRAMTVDLEPAPRGSGSGGARGSAAGRGSGKGSGKGSSDGSGNGIMAPDF